MSDHGPLSRLPRALGALALAATLSLSASFGAARPAAAQGADFLFGAPDGSIGVRAGVSLARARSDLFQDVTDFLTLDRGDFHAPALAADLAWSVRDRVDLVLGVGVARSSARSEFRDWVDEDDRPIEQETRLLQVPVTLGVKAYLAPRGRRVSEFAWIPARLAPFVAAGGGAVHYDFEQEGDFVDFETLDIFTDRLHSDGWGPTGYVAGGLDVSLGPASVLALEARYAAGRADPAGFDDDFATYDAVDLSGLQTTVGLRIRF